MISPISAQSSSPIALPRFPEGVPAPEFNLFQSVKVNGVHGVIVGFNWTSREAAIANRTSMGYLYCIEQDALDNIEAHVYAFPCEITTVEAA